MLTKMLQYKWTSMGLSGKDLSIITHATKDVTSIDAASDEAIVCFYYIKSIIILLTLNNLIIYYIRLVIILVI